MLESERGTRRGNRKEGGREGGRQGGEEYLNSASITKRPSGVTCNRSVKERERGINLNEVVELTVVGIPSD